MIHTYVYIYIDIDVNGCQWMSMDVNGCQWMSMDVNGCQWMSMDVNGCQWMSMDVNGCQWMSMDVNGCQWMSMDVNGCQWMSMDVNGCQWMSMDVNGCQWMSMDVNGCQWINMLRLWPVTKYYQAGLFTKASLLAGVCFPLGMYWGQSFWRRSDLSHRNVPFKWFNHLILTPPPSAGSTPGGDMVQWVAFNYCFFGIAWQNGVKKVVKNNTIPCLAILSPLECWA